MNADFRPKRLQRGAIHPGLIAAVVLLAVVLWLASGLLKSDEPNKSDSTAAQEESRALVKVRTVHSSAVDHFREASVSARTAAARSVSLRAEVSGKITEVLVEAGQDLELGQTIAKVDIGNRKAALVKAEAMRKQRQLQFEAAQRMHKRGHQTEVDLAIARANLAEATAELDKSRKDLENTSITAPFAGRLESLEIELGEFVNVGSDIGLLLEMNPFIVRGYVIEDVIGSIKPGQIGHAVLMDGTAHQGKISYVASAADDRTRTFRVELKVHPEPGKTVILGASAVLAIPLEQLRAHELEPSVLSLSDDGEFGIKTVDGDGIVQFHTADILQNRAGKVWLAGLPDQVEVITIGQGFVSAGDRVETQTDTPSEPVADQSNPIAKPATTTGPGSE